MLIIILRCRYDADILRALLALRYYYAQKRRRERGGGSIEERR